MTPQKLLITTEGTLRLMASRHHAWTIYPKEAEALVAEIDRLRAENERWLAEERVKESDPRLYGHIVGGPPPTPVLGMTVWWEDPHGQEWTTIVGCTPYSYPQSLLRVYAPWGGPLLWSAE